MITVESAVISKLEHVRFSEASSLAGCASVGDRCLSSYSGLRGPQSANVSDQLNRAAMSVSRNIIEGNAHESPRERARYFRYALASVSETEGHIQLGRDLEMITETDFERLVAQVVDVRKMLHGLLKSLGGDK